MASYHHAYRGMFVHTLSLGSMQVFHDYRLAVVDQHGIIVYFDQANLPSLSAVSWTTETLIPEGSFILPTFCDLHLHAPQYLYQGNGLDLPLMQWLDTYALKAEEQLDSDHGLAKEIYKTLARRLLRNGTGAVLLFGTIKEDTNMILAEEMQNAGIRAFVGKLSMDISSRRTYVEPSAQASLDSAESFVSRCRALTQELAPHERRVEPVLTPRFVPTCSDELLHGLGELSEKENLKIQSHLAEAHDEVELVRKERGMEDIDVFEKHKLLTSRTIQAHCTFLSPPDLSRIHDHGTAIAHCPLSNVYFSAEPFRLREALDRNVKVGLGTDIAGGYSVDIMNAMRQAVAVSRMRQGKNLMSRIEQGQDGGEDERNLAIDWKESLYLATRGGSIALGLDSGVFEVGAPFDAQMIVLCDTESGEGVGALDFFSGSVPKLPLNVDMIEKWWCVGDDRNRRSVWVQGNQVVS
ncbi:Metallo-dependent hydrolase [Macrolepiota fuliginosa MF-IS2]|uniref:Metallo-dependent hydrolase n=1 Tax=Macrolepiota fuliginosa MF-IS2 TaxID=1400762 RepID=A0A9P5XLX2_9AGAR|nr:Metallo-dependent hydrolase [Macrolepiota fuliginosa MF-IS2]